MRFFWGGGSQSAVFEGEKSLDMDRGLRSQAVHPIKNNLSTPKG